MNKPTLSLALSASISIAQAGWQAVSAEQCADTMKRMSDAGAVKKSGATQVKKKAVQSAAIKKASTSGINKAVGLNTDHAMLFFSTKGDNAGALSAEAAPAAALSIHPSLPANVDNGSPAEPKTSPTAVDAGDIPIDQSISAKTYGNSQTKSEDLIAQFAADNLLAQNQGGDVTASPIPPVVTGTVDLEEFKSTNVIDLNVSRSRTFKLRNKIVRTSISDPGIAEPVVVAENQIVLLGKAPGKATLVLWDDAGNSAAIDLRVSRDYSQLQSTLREIDPRIIVKAYSVGGSDRLILLGDVDHVESVVRAFAAANVFMDDRGMNIQVANNRLITQGVGERTRSGGGQVGQAQSGQLAQLNSVDRYTFFPNLPNNISTAQGVVSDGGRVTSLIKVRKVPLIVLHVTFMEMNTSASRSLGVSVGLNQSTSGFSFGIGGTPLTVPYTNNYLLSYGGANQILPLTARQPLFNGAGTQQGPVTRNGIAGAYSTVPVALVTPQPGALGNSALSQMYGYGLPTLAQNSLLTSQQVLLGAPGGASFNPGGLGNLFTGISNIQASDAYRLSVQPKVVGTIAHNRSRIIAEPTLVTISGERASFLCGGEIPILQSIATAGQSQFSVTFEPFGLRINMIPVLLENGSINIEISPEERIISNAFAFNFPFSNTNIPGFTTRKAQTIVEMKPGQELFIGGLITTNNGRELNKYPIFGEVPVLGALYRSKAFNKNESELVIAIRPEIILPGTPGQLKLPEEIGRVEGPRDMNMFQVEPSVVDERHYTSGRSERHQKTSPTLPEGAPIPDSR